MRTGAVVIAALLAGGSTLAAQGRQSAPNPPLTLEVGIRGYLSGGQMGSSAGDSATDRLESYVWADQTLCGMGAGDEAPRTTPAVGWHFTGEVVSQSPGQLTVRLEWQRLWERGARLPSARGGGRQVTLRSGERIELDRVAATEVGRCGTVEARLEAAVEPRAPYLMSGVRGGMTGTVGGRGGGVARGRGGEQSGTASGVAGGSGSGVSGSGTTSVGRGGRGGAAGGETFNRPTVTSARGGRGGGSAGAGRGGAVGGVSSGGGTGVSGGEQQTVAQAGRGGGRGGSTGDFYSYLAGSYDAEVWLVHKQPGSPEVVQQQTLRFGPGARDFAFPPIQVNSRGGAITLDISGRLQSGAASRQSRLASLASTYIAAQGRGGQQGQPGQQGAQQGQGRQRIGAVPADSSQAPMFVVSIARRVRRASPFLDTRGATDVSIEIPKPSDVLDFELPPLQRETEDLLKGHIFSIRLRVTPVK